MRAELFLRTDVTQFYRSVILCTQTTQKRSLTKKLLFLLYGTAPTQAASSGLVLSSVTCQDPDFIVALPDPGNIFCVALLSHGTPGTPTRAGCWEQWSFRRITLLTSCNSHDDAKRSLLTKNGCVFH